MSTSRGVHFAITKQQRDHLLSLGSDDEKVDYLQGEIEATWDENNLQQMDKAWLLIHRCLTEDSDHDDQFDPDVGPHPLKLMILGGRQVLAEEDMWIYRLIEAEQLPELLGALEKVEEAPLRVKFDKYCPRGWTKYGEHAFEYAWEYFQYLREFLARVNGTGRSVLFTTSL